MTRPGDALRRAPARGVVAALAAAFACPPALATTQCPRDFGEKSPWIDAMGWGVVALGVVAGIALMVLVARLARGRPWPVRLAATLGGALAMLAIAGGGLAVAVSMVFLRC